MRLLASTRNGTWLSSNYRGCKEKILWQCSLGHKWKATSDNIVQGKWCPKCANINNGARCRKYSADDTKILAALRGGWCLSDRIRGVAYKLRWKCLNGHMWGALLGSVIRGSWCPYCSRYITENKCRYIMEKLTGVDFPRNGRVSSPCVLDGYNNDLNMAFEYNGKQHYQRVKWFHKTEDDFKHQKDRDKYKLDRCKKKECQPCCNSLLGFTQRGWLFSTVHKKANTWPYKNIWNKHEKFLLSM